LGPLSSGSKNVGYYDVSMDELDASINVSEEYILATFRVKIKNVTPCHLPNYSTIIPEDNILC
jgi:hypothetical protein